MPEAIPELQETHTAQETEDDNVAHMTPTRHKLETLEAMNATNISHGTETAIEHIGTTDQTTEAHEEHAEAGSSTSHGYNLRPRPTKQYKKISLLQTT